MDTEASAGFKRLRYDPAARAESDKRASARLLVLAGEHARTVHNAVKIAQEYSQQGAGQQDWRAPHLALFGLPNVPVITRDKRITQRQHARGGSNSDSDAEGGALPLNFIRHVLDVRINSIKNGQINRDAQLETRRLASANVPQPAVVLSLQERIAEISRVLESGLPGSKLIEKANALIPAISLAAPTLSREDAELLLDDMRNISAEADDRLASGTLDAKAAAVLQTVSKQFHDIERVLNVALGYSSAQEKATQVAEARGTIARRPGADLRKRRIERQGARAQAQADADAELARARAEAVAAAEAGRADRAAALIQRLNPARRRRAAAAAPVARQLFTPEGVRVRIRDAQAAEADAEAAAARGAAPQIGTDAFRARVSEVAADASASHRREPLVQFAALYGINFDNRTSIAAMKSILLEQ